MVFYHGAPFKFNTSLRGQHNKFIFGTQFSPDGSTLVTVGADRRIWLYDGKTGEAKTQIGDGVHTGSIFGVSWAPDSKRFVTASADQTVRVWDAEAGKNTHTWRMGEEGSVSIPDQQVGVVWPAGRSDGLIISVDLEGNLNYLKEGSQKPTRVVRGHQKNITSAAISNDTFYTGSYEGRVCAWDVSNGEAAAVDGSGPTNYVAGLSADPNGSIYTVSWDDTLRSISERTFTGTQAPLPGQPKSVAVSGSTVHIICGQSIVTYKGGSKAGDVEVKFTPTAIAANANIVAVGGDDKAVHIFSHDLKPISASPRNMTGPISTLSFSPSGSHLAAGATNGKIYVYSTSDWSVATDRWSAHTARVTCIAWDERGENAVSGSLDTNVFVWSLKDPGKRVKAGNAHKDGVNGVAWTAKGVLSTGGDATVKAWKVSGL